MDILIDLFKFSGCNNKWNYDEISSFILRILNLNTTVSVSHLKARPIPKKLARIWPYMQSFVINIYVN